VERLLALRPDLASSPPGTLEASKLPGEVPEWLDEWGVRPPRRELFERLVAEALGWEGVRHRITSGRKGQTRFAG